MNVVKGKIIASGKTKVLHEVLDRPDIAVIENKGDITAFDDPTFTKQFAAKARFATTTTSRVFELLQRSNIPVAFERQLSETEFLARALQMISLEVVARRYAVGSYLSRNPDLKKLEGEVPHSFYPLKVEAFLKTTGGKFTTIQGEVIDLGLDAKKGEEDPLILNPLESEWKLYHPKKPLTDPEADLKRTILASQVLAFPHHMQMIFNIAGATFLVIEDAMGRVKCYLIDYKVEFGYPYPLSYLETSREEPDSDAKPTIMTDPILGDVIDNDSWRLRTNEWLELSKQAFRDGEALSEVERKYGIVAEMVSRPEFMNLQ